MRWARCRVTRANLEELASLVEGGLEVVTDRVFALEDAAEAVQHMLDHHARGKVVLRI